jgi:hypothetical protein
MKGFVQQRGSRWYYKFRLPERDPGTGRYSWITKGGFDTEREAWKACREAMRDADGGGSSSRQHDATTWRNWSECARWYVIPHIGAEPLQRLDEPQLLRLYAKLLSGAG